MVAVVDGVHGKDVLDLPLDDPGQVEPELFVRAVKLLQEDEDFDASAELITGDDLNDNIILKDMTNDNPTKDSRF